MSLSSPIKVPWRFRDDLNGRLNLAEIVGYGIKSFPDNFNRYWSLFINNVPNDSATLPAISGERYILTYMQISQATAGTDTTASAQVASGGTQIYSMHSAIVPGPEQFPMRNVNINSGPITIIGNLGQNLMLSFTGADGSNFSAFACGYRQVG